MGQLIKKFGCTEVDIFDIFLDDVKSPLLGSSKI